MELPHFLRTPPTKSSSIFSSDKTRSFHKRAGFGSTDELKTSKLDAQIASYNKSLFNKVQAEMDNSKKKIVEKIQEIDHQIYLNKLPFLKYYDPATDKLKSQQEITNEIHKTYDFFQPDASLFKGSKYKPESFFYSTPKRRTKGLSTPRSKLSTGVFDTPGREDVVIRTLEYSTEKTKKPYLKALAVKDIGLTDHPSIQEEDDARLSINASTQNETLAPSMQLQSGEKSARLTRRDELIEFEDKKIPASLFRGAAKRKVVLEELRRDRSNRTLDTNLVKSVEKKYKQIDQEHLSSQTDGKRLGKEEISTRNPIANVYYQVLVMPKAQKKALAQKLNLVLPEEGGYKNVKKAIVNN